MKSHGLQYNSWLIGTSDFESSQNCTIDEPLGECNLRIFKITSTYYSRIVQEGRVIFYL